MADGDFDWPDEPPVSPAGGFFIQHRWGDEFRPFEVIISWPDSGLANFWRDNTFEMTGESIAIASHNGSIFVAWVGLSNEAINIARLVLSGDSTHGYSVSGMEGKVILDETSDRVPALASSHGRLFLAWKGSGNEELNLMFSSDNGRSFQDKRLLREKSDTAPTLTSHANSLFVAWKGFKEEIHVAKVTLFGNTAGGFGIEGLQDKVPLGETTSHAPALASHDGRLFVAWKGSGNNDLNVMFSGDGTIFQGRRTFQENVGRSVALTSSTHGLFAAWKRAGGAGDRGPLRVARVVLFGTTTGGLGIEGLQTEYPGETSDQAPALASIGASIVLAWKGGDEQLNFVVSNDDGTTFRGKRAFGHTFQWHGPILFGSGQYAGATVLESDFRADSETRTGNLEVLATRTDGVTEHYWRDNNRQTWHGPFEVPVISKGNGACGPSMYYSGAYFLENPEFGFDFNEHGRSIFAAVVSGWRSGFDLYFRINPANDEGGSAHWKAIESRNSERIVGLAIAKLVRQWAAGSNGEPLYADEGWLSDGISSAIVAVTYNGRLQLHAFEAKDPNVTYPKGVLGAPGNPFSVLDGEFTGRPGLLQGDYGYRAGIPFTGYWGHYGGLELIVPSKLGGAIHFHQDGGSVGEWVPVGERWGGGTRIPGPLVYDELSFLESTFKSNDTYHLELIARVRNQRGFDFYTRDGNMRWHGPQRVPAGPEVPAGVWLRGLPGAGQPRVAAGTSPTSWYTTPENVQHVAYVGDDQLIHELFHRIGGSAGWEHTVPGAGQPRVAAGTSPTSWYTTPENVQHVAYVGDDQLIHELFHRIGGSAGWEHTVPGAGRPRVAAGTSPTSWYTTPENVQHVAYVGDDQLI
ncbi:hypothetical protein, partial [Streptomyces sp. NPDC018031]|uniref:hypothetical protein n=1 Tax=Streptomyces sp. NPDC018031 TaxID=3365033 RepID=UPI0037B047E2